MHLIDWLFMLLPVIVVICIGAYTQRYIKSVAHYLSGGRVAGRYMLAVAQGELQSGAIVFMALFQVVAQAGFTMNWWTTMANVSILVVAMTGFVTYRYRETRVMTLSQFFEVRYSRPFRLFTGILGFCAGIFSFGIHPALGARFFIYFLGLPETLTIYSCHVPTYIPLMAFFVIVTVVLTLSGGVITVMVTNCIEGIMTQMFYLVIIFAVLAIFGWSYINEVLVNKPPGQSLLNPFDCAGQRDFNFNYMFMFVVIGMYGTMAWQNASGYNSAPLNPHESRMGAVLGRWRVMGRDAMITLVGICALVFLQHPHFADQASTALHVINQIANPHTRDQVQIPIAASYFLPIGVKGIFCAIMLMGVFGGDATHMHSWSSIFIQDVILPLRKKPFTPEQHIRMLRLSVVGVGIFCFFFGMLMRQTEYIVMWWNLTGAIYVGGAGSAIIGGLYWKKGTTAGAWVAMITGSVLCTGGIILQQLHDAKNPFILRLFGPKLPLNGMEMSFVAVLTAIILYVVISLLTCKENFNMDRMLHRGQYAKSVSTLENTQTARPKGKDWLSKLVGMDEDYSRGDKWIAGSLFGWSIFWFVIFVIGGVWNWISPFPVSAWSTYWHITGIGLPILLAVVTGVWFTWGGVRDMKALFRRLRESKVNPLDDGTVIGHQNLDEVDGQEKIALRAE